MRRQNNRFRRFTIDKETTCSCGGKAKLRSRRNYPFGKNSKPRRTNFYKCKSCGEVKVLVKANNKGRR